MINFEEIPEWWALCPNEHCPKASLCLRRQAYLNPPKRPVRWTCLLPTAWQGDECKYFQDMEPVMIARGFKSIFKVISNRYDRARVRRSLMGHFGSNGSYYRYRNGERVLGPAEQKYIKDLVVNCCHCEEERIRFDQTYISYNFTDH